MSERPSGTAPQDPTRPKSDDELVELLRNNGYKAGYLEASLMIARDDLSRAVNLMAKGVARELIEERVAEIDRVLALVKRAAR